jgi:hypothetical protein
MPLPPSNAMPRMSVGRPAGMRWPLPSEVTNERTVKRVIGRVFTGGVPGATQTQSLSGTRYPGAIQKPSNA